LDKLKANYSGLNTKRPVPEAAARANTCLSPNLIGHSERLVLLSSHFTIGGSIGMEKLSILSYV
jgi:hypothetical protein